MSDRFKPLAADALGPDQRAVWDQIAAGPRRTVPWIFHLLLDSPELAAKTQNLGAFCRYGTGLPPHLSELAILIVSKHWEAVYEWSVHEHEARKAGISDAVITAIAEGRRPDFPDADSALVYDFATEFFRTKDVSDALFARAVERFGRKTVLELAGVLGYYSMLAIELRIFRVPPQA